MLLVSWHVWKRASRKGMASKYDPIVDAMDIEELTAFLKNIKTSVTSTVGQLPTHKEFINFYCKAEMHSSM